MHSDNDVVVIPFCGADVADVLHVSAVDVASECTLTGKVVEHLCSVGRNRRPQIALSLCSVRRESYGLAVAGEHQLSVFNECHRGFLVGFGVAHSFCL